LNLMLEAAATSVNLTEEPGSGRAEKAKQQSAAAATTTPAFVGSLLT